MMWPMNPGLATALLVLALLACLALMLVGPLRAVRDEQAFSAEERGWASSKRFPEEVERIYRSPRMVTVDGLRLRELGYEQVEHGLRRTSWGRRLAVRWQAVRPPARAPEASAGDSPEDAGVAYPVADSNRRSPP